MRITGTQIFYGFLIFVAVIQMLMDACAGVSLGLHIDEAGAATFRTAHHDPRHNIILVAVLVIPLVLAWLFRSEASST